MKLNGKNIVFDDDITMTGNNAGEKLSDIIGGLQSDTNKLKSHLKWIYNHGGVGGSGNGGGGGDSEFILFATLNEIQMKGQIMSLGGAGNYPLKISVQRPGGSTFTAKYKIKDNNTVLEESGNILLDVNNSYTFEKDLRLETNATLIVTVTDSLYNITKQAEVKFVTRSYDIKSFFVDNEGKLLGDEITIGDAKNNGLNINLDYSVAVTYKYIEYKLTLNLPNKTIVVDKDGDYRQYYIPILGDRDKDVVKLDLINIAKGVGWEPVDENAGYYSYELSINIAIEGQIIKPIVNNVSFNLIPKDLYLLVSPTKGNIYSKEIGEDEKPYKFNPGYITFNLKPYMGFKKDDRCEIIYKLDEGREDRLQSSLRKQETIKVYAVNEGLNKLNVKLECGGNYYPSKDTFMTYYFYLNREEDGIFWYNLDEKTKRTGKFNYYRGGELDGVNSSGDGEWTNRNFKQFRKAVDYKTYRQSINREPLMVNLCDNKNGGKSILDVPDMELPSLNTNVYDTIIHIGLQYSEINKIKDSVIFTGYKTIDNTSKVAEEWLFVYQDHIKIGKEVGGKEIKFYFPKTKDNFAKSTDDNHLLSIAFRYMYTIGYIVYYELTVYIDGVLESASKDYIEEEPRIVGGIFGKSNLYVDLLDISFLDPIREGKNTVAEDFSIYQYYLRYHSNKINRQDTEEIHKFNMNKTLLTHGRKVEIHNNGEVTCDETTAINIAKNLTVPTMMMVIQDNDGSVKDYFDKSFSENDGEVEYNTSIKWSAAGKELNSVDFPKEFSSAMFKVKIQGSSTKSYKCKNFTLSLVNELEGDERPVYLFSPNFSTTDTSTFLPEQQFTLKADVVDSSHSNNTSIGRFVNDITQKFNTGGSISSNNNLNQYIKNCLDGFPFVLFIQYIKSTPEGDIKTCYYQGVYNFNLGRESHFNLGYSDYKVFCDPNGQSKLKNADNGFLFYSVPKSNMGIKNGLIVAEIQGNDNLFDFSQFDTSVLFYQNKKGDNKYMFGDLVTGSDITSNHATSVIKNMVERVSRAGGYLFGKNFLKKSFSESLEDSYGYDSENGGYHAVKQVPIGVSRESGEQLYKSVAKNQVPNYRHQFHKEISPEGEISFVPYERVEEEAQDKDLGELILEEDFEGQKVDPWINYRSLSEYYTICMAFGLVDSVQKNMNIKTWNARPSSGRATFYTAFYDMDTCLGVNNEGKDVSYFAFSDYWDYSEEKSAGGSLVKPSPVTIYRDFSPKSGNNNNAGDFYDTPSSYLFAVAKYARVFYNDSSAGDSCLQNEVSYWPKELWRLWRSEYKENDPNNMGCLSSAEFFMSKYFSNNLGSVCPLLISMNYRNKYLVKLKGEEEKSTFNKANFEKFNGTRIHKATDWLSSRFHILDAYFNVTNSISTYQYYNEDGIYDKVKDLQEPYIQDSELIKTNEDVIVYQDIFAGNQMNQGAGTLDIIVRAHEYSPLFITVANTSSQRFLLGGDSQYNIVTPLSGTQTYTFGGSGAWTELNSINSFNFSSLNVNSKYLETLESDNTNKMSVNSNNIIMPSLRLVNLSGPNFTGNLDLNGSKFTNLEQVNVSNSSINLSINNSSCTKVNISGMKKSSVSLVNCPEIDTIVFGSGYANNPSTELTKFDLRPLPPKFSRSGIELNYTNIREIVLVNNTKNNTKFVLKNDSVVEKIDLKGFREIDIEGCNKLNKIVLADPDAEGLGDNLYKLTVKGCGKLAEVLNIGPGDTINSEVNLEDFKELTELEISNCTNIRRVKLQNDPNHRIYLREGAFYNDVRLQYLSGSELIICGPRVFENCGAFTLQQGPEGDPIYGKQTKLTLDSNLTDLTEMFSTEGGHITLEAAKNFLTTTVGIEKVTKINYLFNGQNIKYGEEELLSDLTDGKNSITLDTRHLKNVTDAVGFLSWNALKAWHPYMLGFGANVSKVNIGSFGYRTTTTVGSGYKREGHITVPIDIFYPIIDKITGYIGWSSSTGNYCRLRVVKVADGKLQTYGRTSSDRLILKNLFHPTVGGVTKHPKYITSIKNICFYDDYYERLQEETPDVPLDPNKLLLGKTCDLYLSFKDLFKNWNSLEYIEGFLFDKNISSSYPASDLEGLLYYLPNFKYIKDSLDINNSSYPINLYKFFNWNYLKSGYDPFTNSKGNSTEIDKGSFFLHKFITESDFTSIWYYLVVKKVSGASNLFRNCTLLCESSPTISSSDDERVRCPSLKYLNNTFRKFKVLQVKGDEIAAGDTTLRNIAINNEEKRRLYYSINPFFFLVLNGVVELQYTFADTMITTPMPNTSAIPMNFFYKRKENLDKSIYYVSKEDLEASGIVPNKKGYYIYKEVDTGNIIDQKVIDTFKKATLHYYTYSHTITDMTHMFYNVKWENNHDLDTKLRNARSYIPEKDASGYRYLQSDYIELPDLNLTKENTEYYSSYITTEAVLVDGEYIPKRVYGFKPSGKLSLNTEIKDIKEVTESKDPLGGYSQYIVSPSITGIDYKFTNYLLDKDVENKLFIAPDFFYSCSDKGCNIEGVFGCDTALNNDECLEGMIPEHLLKYCKRYSIKNMMKNLNIIPKYRQTENLGETLSRRVYSYVPPRFTEMDDLSYSFNFHFMAPPKEYNEGSKTIKTVYYYLLGNSIENNVTSLRHSFPSVYFNRSESDNLFMEDSNEGLPDSHKNDFKMHVNLMHTITNTTTTSPTGETIVSNYQGDDGLDMNKFRKLNLDNLVPSVISFFLSGNLFRGDSFLLNNIRWSSPKNFVLYAFDLNRSSGYDCISRNCRLPSTLTGTDKKLTGLYIYNFYRINLYSTQIINGQNPEVKKMYGTIQGNPENPSYRYIKIVDLGDKEDY